MSGNTDLTLDLYDAKNSAWIDSDDYIITLPEMPQIYNNRDCSLVANLFKITVSSRVTTLISGLLTGEPLETIITAIKIYKPDDSRLYFQGVIKSITYDAFKMSYEMIFIHEFESFKNHKFLRATYNTALLAAGDENVKWKAGTKADSYNVSPNQYLEVLFDAVLGKTIDTSQLPIDLDTFYIDRGAGFAIGQEIASDGTGFNTDIHGTVFDVINNICIQCNCYIAHKIGTYDDYIIVYNVDYDSSDAKLNTTQFAPTDNNLISSTEKVIDYIRLNTKKVDTIEAFVPATNPYEITTQTALTETTFNETYFSGAPFKNVIQNLKSNCVIGAWLNDGVDNNFIYQGMQIPGTAYMKYYRLVKEYNYTVPIITTLYYNTIKHDLQLSKQLGLISKITIEKLKYNGLLKEVFTTNNQGLITFSAKDNTADAWKARSAYDTYWESDTYDVENPDETWVKVDLGELKNISKVFITGSGYNDYEVKGSINNSTYTTITTTTDEYSEVVFTVPQRYRYVQVYFSAVNRVDGETTKVKRLQIYERIA